MDMRALFIQQARHPTGPAVGIKRPRRPFSSAPPHTQKQKTCKLAVYRFPASSRPCLGGEYEILSCVSHFFLLAEYQYFISLFLSGLRNFCPESVPGNNFNISVLFEKIRQNLLSDICTSGRTYLLDNALFLQQTIDGAMLFGDSVLL